MSRTPKEPLHFGELVISKSFGKYVRLNLSLVEAAAVLAGYRRLGGEVPDWATVRDAGPDRDWLAAVMATIQVAIEEAEDSHDETEARTDAD